MSLIQKARDGAIGILGGMGPQASCEIYRLVNQKCCAMGQHVRNADYPQLIINNLPVPDLIADAKDKDVTVAMVRDGARALARAGSTDILMACNTMHVFQEEITDGLQARFHSLIDAVADSALQAREVLVLGSRTTIESSLYQNAFAARNVCCREPGEALLAETVDIIKATISGRVTKNDIRKFVGNIVNEANRHPSIDTIALACTELPLVFPKRLKGYKLLNSLEEGAKKIMSLHFEGVFDEIVPNRSS